MLFIDPQKQDKFKVLFEGKTDLGTVTKVKVRFTQADEKNGNGRTYPLALWNREVNRIQDDINAGGVLGMSKHPKDAVTDAGDVSHIVKKLWMDGKTGWAELAILDTTKGKNLKTILKANGRLAVSTRGFGTTAKDTGVVNDDYRLDNIDITTNPSYKGGFFSQDSVFEGQDLSKKKDKPAEPKDYYEESKITGVHPELRAKQVNEDRNRPTSTPKRTALYAQVWASFGQSATKEIVNEAVDKILAHESEICKKPPVVIPPTLSESEKIVEAKKKKRQKRIFIKQGMYKDGFLAGFTREQIDIAIEKKMAQLDIEEMEE